MAKKKKEKMIFFFYNISYEHGTKTFSKWSIKKYSKEVPKKKKNKQTNKCPKGILFSFGPFQYMSYIDGVIWFVTVDTWSECCALLVQPMLSLDLLPSKANFAMLSLSL